MSRITIIDDDAASLGLVRELMELDRHEVTIYTNGEDALAALFAPGAERPHLIITDVMMPGMDGFTLHQRLRENERTRRIPLIVVSAKNKLREAFAQSSNVASFLEKPYDLSDLRRAVAAALAQR